MNRGKGTYITGRDRSPIGLPASPQLSAEDAAEKARAERRRVIALNKLAKIATEVRATFLRTLLTRKTPPPTTAVWVTTQLVTDMSLLTVHNGRSIACELLGYKAHTMHADMVPDGTNDNRAQIIGLALVLGSLESRVRKDQWRPWNGSGVGGYLQFLRELGYTLSEIEEVIAGERKPDDVTLPD